MNSSLVFLSEIETMFRHAGLPIRRDTLRKALELHRRSFLGNSAGGFSLAILGKRDAEKFLQQGDVTVQFCDGNTPRTSRKKLRELLGTLNGVIRICDPYYGVRILDSIEAIPSSSSICFLTQQTGENPIRLAGPMKDYLRQYPQTSFRMYPKHLLLHDRYVLSDDQLLIIGHGLKDIGWKESFIFHFQQKALPDMHLTLKSAFDTKWQQATAIQF